jgi:hypothetical protein
MTVAQQGEAHFLNIFFFFYLFFYGWVPTRTGYVKHSSHKKINKIKKNI